MLNVAKNEGTAKEYVSCNVAIRMIFGGTGERTISCFNIWSISAYAIVNSFHRNNLTFVFWPSSCAPERAIVVLTGLQNMPNINRRVRHKTVLTRYGKYFFSTEYCLRVFFEDVSTDKKSSIFDLLRPHPEFSDNHRQK